MLSYSLPAPTAAACCSGATCSVLQTSLQARAAEQRERGGGTNLGTSSEPVHSLFVLFCKQISVSKFSYINAIIILLFYTNVLRFNILIEPKHLVTFCATLFVRHCAGPPLCRQLVAGPGLHCSALQWLCKKSQIVMQNHTQHTLLK